MPSFTVDVEGSPLLRVVRRTSGWSSRAFSLQARLEPKRGHQSNKPRVAFHHKTLRREALDAETWLLHGFAELIPANVHVSKLHVMCRVPSVKGVD